MKPAKLAPTFLVVPFALAALACPTRPIDKGAGTEMDGGDAGHGIAGAEAAGASGAAGSSAGGAGGAIGGHAGAAAGSGGGTAGSGFAGGGGGAAGTAGAAAGAAGASAGAGGGAAGAGGGEAGSGGGAAGSGGVRDGQPCAIALDCASGLCKGFYLDVDGDGYGAGPPVGFCGSTAPIGYASMNGDCCDNATNIAVAKLIHPGADFQTTSAGGVCGITWDYDCSGTVESNPQDCVSCSDYPSCQCITGNRPEASCGTSGIDAHTCVTISQTQSCMHTAASGGPGTITCK
jgi:hypothetical protein